MKKIEGLLFASLLQCSSNELSLKGHVKVIKKVSLSQFSCMHVKMNFNSILCKNLNLSPCPAKQLCLSNVIKTYFNIFYVLRLL